MNLEHFDTILAFTTVMAGLSLCITALSQAVSGLLGLRGLNLMWGLEKLFRTLAPEAGGRAKTLAEQILLHPLLSDSTFGGVKRRLSFWRFASHIQERELVNLLQAWATAFAMPQTNDQEKAARAEAFGALNLEAPLRQIAAELCLAYVKKTDEAGIAPEVLNSLPQGALRAALALPQTSATEKAARTKALDALSHDASIVSDAAQLLRSQISSVQAGRIPPQVMAVLPAALGAALAMPETTDQEKTLRQARLNGLDIPALFMENAGELLQRQIQKIQDGLKNWFDAGMARVSQRFASNMRVITVAGASILSIVLVVDSIDLWRRLAKNPELRNQVIASSDALLQKANEMQAGSTNVPAAAYRVAADQLLAMHTNALAGFSGTESITNLASGTTWLVTQCKTCGVTNSARWLEEYQALVPQAALRQAADTLRNLLENQLSLDVISSWRTGESWPAAFCAHWGGILVSIALLSLGAPFWFNALKRLASLRPALAKKEDEQAKKTS